jgi:hypothetical protein
MFREKNILCGLGANWGQNNPTGFTAVMGTQWMKNTA